METGIEKRPAQETPPQREKEPKSPEKLFKDLIAEVEGLEEVSETEKKLGERFDISEKEVREIAEKHTFTEKLSSIKNKIGEVAGGAIEKIKGMFERKGVRGQLLEIMTKEHRRLGELREQAMLEEYKFRVKALEDLFKTNEISHEEYLQGRSELLKFKQASLMERMIQNNEEYILGNPNASREDMMRFLVDNAGNEMRPSREMIADIEEGLDAFVKNREGLKEYATELAQKFGVKEIPENVTDLLNSNPQIKVEFLKVTAGIEPDDIKNFEVVTDIPGILGIKCKSDESWVEHMAKRFNISNMIRGRYLPQEKFGDEAGDEDERRNAKLNFNIFLLNGALLSKLSKKDELETIMHEVQHQHFNIIYGRYRRMQREFLQFDMSEENLQKIIQLKGKESAREYIEKYEEKYKLLTKEKEKRTPHDVLETQLQNELSAHLKGGSYEYRPNSLFGRDYAKNVEDDLEFKSKVENLMSELRRLHFSGIPPAEIYPTILAEKDLTEMVHRLRVIKTERLDPKLTKCNLSLDIDFSHTTWFLDYAAKNNIVMPEVASQLEKNVLSFIESQFKISDEQKWNVLKIYADRIKNVTGKSAKKLLSKIGK